MRAVSPLLLAFALASAFGIFSGASAATLNLGDPAPALQTGKFLQGDPVKEFAPDKAYIVEFWATWCGPCRASIPHLNETYLKFKDKGLTVIGQDCLEQDDSKVAAFVKSMGDKMTYRVALDDKSGSDKGKMAETWLMAAGQNGIPTAFLVDTTGHIAWIGHPMALKAKTIEQVMAGTFNAKETAAAEEKEHVELQSINSKLQAALTAKDWTAANTDLDELAKIAPEDTTDYVSIMRFKIFIGQKDYSAAVKIMKQLADAHKDQPMMQNDLAWMLVTDKSIEHPDLNLAQTLAQRAIDGAKEPAEKCRFMDTMARVKFLQGAKEEAIALEQKALALADENEKERLQKALDSYKKGEVPEAN